jgi:uncharacterized protein
METILFTLGAFVTVVLIMSVGVLFKRKPIAGSCGGIANLMGSCDICEKRSECFDKLKSDCSEDEEHCH